MEGYPQGFHQNNISHSRLWSCETTFARPIREDHDWIFAANALALYSSNPLSPTEWRKIPFLVHQHASVKDRTTTPCEPLENSRQGVLLISLSRLIQSRGCIVSSAAFKAKTRNVAMLPASLSYSEPGVWALGAVQHRRTKGLFTSELKMSRDMYDSCLWALVV